MLNVARDDNDPETLVARARDAQHLANIIDQLSEEHRSVILLHEVEGYTLDEMQVILASYRHLEIATTSRTQSFAHITGRWNLATTIPLHHQGRQNLRQVKTFRNSRAGGLNIT